MAGPGPSDGVFFGRAVRIGAFGNGGPSDLAVSAPDETVGGVARAGTVRVLYGSSAGPGTAESQFWHQDRPNVVEVAEVSEYFGGAL